MRHRWRLSVLGVLLVLLVLPGWSAADSGPGIQVIFDQYGREVATIDEDGTVTLHEVTGSPAPEEPEALATDPDLEPGFPVITGHKPGRYMGGAGIHTLVANIDSDSRLEIVATALANGPLFAWNYDGTVQLGWPVSPGPGGGAAYPAVGKLGLMPRKTMVAHYGCTSATNCTTSVLIAYDAVGKRLPGWPIFSANYTPFPPSLADVVMGGYSEIFLGEEDWKLHGYRHDASVLPGWPIFGWGGQQRMTPAIADLDGDGDLEIVAASGWTTSGVYVHAYHHTGTPVAGFPFKWQPGAAQNWPAIGDVDRDGKPDIVLVSRGFTPKVWIYSATGVFKRKMNLIGTVPYGSAPALADLDGNGTPEIIVQTDTALNVFYGDGRTYPGWPVSWLSSTKIYWMGNSSPVVGDVNGDQKPDIVVTTHDGNFGSTVGELRAYSAKGILLPRFPKVLAHLGSGGVPAIADFDRDGRNEIIICGDYWNGVASKFPKCWAFDLHGSSYGRIEWGQFGGGPSHQNRYPVPDLP